MISHSRKNCSDTSRKVFSALSSPVRTFPRSCKYQSSATSLALERLSSLVLVRQFLPAKKLEHCQRLLFGRLYTKTFPPRIVCRSAIFIPRFKQRDYAKIRKSCGV